MRNNGSNLERKTAKELGTKRVHRSHFGTAPDVEPIPLADGRRVVVECKSRKALPKLLSDAMSQCQGYSTTSDVPAVVFEEPGRQPFLVLSLADFRSIIECAKKEASKPRRELSSSESESVQRFEDAIRSGLSPADAARRVLSHP